MCKLTSLQRFNIIEITLDSYQCYLDSNSQLTKNHPRANGLDNFQTKIFEIVVV